MLIGKSDDQDTVRMSMRWGKRRLRKKYFRGRKKSLSEQPRKYFNEKAAHWDQMVEDKTLQGLDLIIKGLEIKPVTQFLKLYIDVIPPLLLDLFVFHKAQQKITKSSNNNKDNKGIEKCYPDKAVYQDQGKAQRKR
jgi:hypothetical protein